MIPTAQRDIPEPTTRANAFGGEAERTEGGDDSLEHNGRASDAPSWATWRLRRGHLIGDSPSGNRSSATANADFYAEISVRMLKSA